MFQLDNINICLSVLRAQHVAGVESVSGQDLRDGRLKAVLALFFALSRHKQATKQRAQVQVQQQQHIQQNQQVDMTPNRYVTYTTRRTVCIHYNELSKLSRAIHFKTSMIEYIYTYLFYVR